MSSTRLLFPLLLAALVAAVAAFYPGPEPAAAEHVLQTTARKFKSVAVKRDELADKDFKFSFKRDGTVVSIGNIRAEFIRPPRHRLLGLKDVDITAIRVFQQSEAVIPWHSHPRGSENYVTMSGTLELTIKLEGLVNVRKVKSILKPGTVSSIPQGLPHTVKCVSEEKCVYHIFFNSADSGFTPA